MAINNTTSNKSSKKANGFFNVKLKTSSGELTIGAIYLYEDKEVQKFVLDNADKISAENLSVDIKVVDNTPLSIELV